MKILLCIVPALNFVQKGKKRSETHKKYSNKKHAKLTAILKLSSASLLQNKDAINGGRVGEKRTKKSFCVCEWRVHKTSAAQGTKLTIVHN